MSGPTKLHPLVQWAQREKVLFLTIEVDKIDKLEVAANQILVRGTYSGSSAEFEAAFEFYANVNPSYRRIPGDRHLELVIEKESSGWWPRLLKKASKVPWIKVDFNKWKDEDEEDEEDMPGGFDFNNYMANIGGNSGEGPSMKDFVDEDEDDDEMPELEDAEDNDVKEKAEEKTETKEAKEKEKKENGVPVEQNSS